MPLPKDNPPRDATSARARRARLTRAGAVYWPAHHVWIMDTAAAKWSGAPAMLYLSRMGWSAIPARYVPDALLFYATHHEESRP